MSLVLRVVSSLPPPVSLAVCSAVVSSLVSLMSLLSLPSLSPLVAPVLLVVSLTSPCPPVVARPTLISLTPAPLPLPFPLSWLSCAPLISVAIRVPLPCLILPAPVPVAVPLHTRLLLWRCLRRRLPPSAVSSVSVAPVVELLLLVRVLSPVVVCLPVSARPCARLTITRTVVPPPFSIRPPFLLASPTTARTLTLLDQHGCRGCVVRLICE